MANCPKCGYKLRMIDIKAECPKCGVNLNEVQCDCPTKEIDPRLAVLKDLFKNK